MANHWLGRAKAVAQVSTITVGGTIAIGDTFSVTINGKSVTFTATAATIANVVAGLLALLNDTTAPIEHGELTWTDSSPTLVGTADVAGVPHTITVSETGAASTIAIATTVAATGPNHLDNAANWSDGTVPAGGDDVVFANSNQSMLYGFDGSAAILGELVIEETFTGSIGLPAINVLGYREYRTQTPNWSYSLSTVRAVNAGEIRLKIDNDSGAGTLIQISGTVRVLASTTGSIYDIQNGTLIIGEPTAEDITVGSLKISSAASVIIDKNVACTAITNVGSLDCQSSTAPTTVTNRGGTATFAKNPTTTYAYSGTVVLNGDNTVTTLVVGPDTADGQPGEVDLSEDMRTFGITNITLNGRGSISDPNQRITGTHTLTINASKIAGS